MGYILKDLRVIAFTHKNLGLNKVGKLVVAKEEVESLLGRIKFQFPIDEIIYLATCNRVEFIFTSTLEINNHFIHQFLSSLQLTINHDELNSLASEADFFSEEAAMVHLLRMSSSLESLVVGEKEILAQVRLAYDESKALGFTGDKMRIVMNRVVKTAKEIYTNTKIAEKPISVVSIACRTLRALSVPNNARYLFIGAGETNQLFAKYLKKHQGNQFVVFNRTFEKAKSLADELNGEAFPLEELMNYKKGFDVIITCTGATQPIITKEIYESLLNSETDKKVILDLAIPNDTHEEVIVKNLHYISMETLQNTVKRNMEDRYAELCNAEQIIEENMTEFKSIIRQRSVELAMQEVPQKIKEIRQTAVCEVFAEDMRLLDQNSKEVLDRILNYMEKKYISIPMLMAKDILTKE